ncbi:hypothetical protein [Bradyrhizobium elkanii]
MDSLEPMGLLLVEFAEGLKTRGNAVVRSRSKAASCSSRRFSTAALSSRGSSVLSNRRQRQISFLTHLISLNLSSIEVITNAGSLGHWGCNAYASALRSPSVRIHADGVRRHCSADVASGSMYSTLLSTDITLRWACERNFLRIAAGFRRYDHLG